MTSGAATASRHDCRDVTAFALPPIAVTLGSPMTELVEAMQRTQLRAIPVVCNGHPVGMVTWRDIFTTLSHRFASDSSALLAS